MTELRTDQNFQTIAAAFERVRVGFMQRLEQNTRREAIRTAHNVSQRNKNVLDPLFRVLRVDPFQQEPWLNEAMANWTTENVSRVKSVGEEMLRDLEQELYRMLRQGRSRKETIEALQRKFGVTEYRAALIARDQVNKFNGQLNMERQTRLGVSTYIWRTMGGQRVRGKPGGLYPDAVPSHWAMEGVLCRWDDPTVFHDGRKWRRRKQDMPKEHPGQPIQCRCFAMPNLKEILA